MKAHIEFTNAIIRTGPEFNDYGDPYDFICNVVFVEKTAYIVGAAGNFSQEKYKAIFELIKSMGYEKAVWQRRKNGKIKNMEQLNDC